MRSEPLETDGARGACLPEGLRCPMTGKPLELEPDGQWVQVVGEAIRYPIRQGVPILVASAAQRTNDPLS